LKCLLIAPFNEENVPVRRIVAAAAKGSGIQLVSPGEQPSGLMFSEAVFAEIAGVDLVVAVTAHRRANIFYEIGLAHALGKPVVFLGELGEGETGVFPVPPIGLRLEFSRTESGLDRLHITLRKLFADFAHNPDRFLTFRGRTALPMIDFDKLEPREIENLCFELLTQMGFRRVEWGKELKEIDVVATLPKKDPDGFEYNELWIISMGLHAPPEMLLGLAEDPEYIIHRLFRPDFVERFRSFYKRDTPVTLLLMLLRSEGPSEPFEQELRRVERRLAGRGPFSIRFRTWDRQHITGLIQQYPQLAYKYFSEEGREQSKSRKTTEELYKETAALNERLRAVNTALKEESEKRIRAERDAVWKDVAFKAAHKLGNPIFALETGLQGIKRRIKDNPDEALKVAEEMGASIEKAKGIIEQFKSLIRAQEISKRAVDLKPLIQAASRVATENGVEVTVETNGDSVALADPTRMTECFDELFANALHWINRPQKHISVSIDHPKKKELPQDLDETKKYIRIRFGDNGCGVNPQMKKQIFAPFYTTHPHGTGLGLFMVERIIQGHDGAICETGTPDESAVFEIFLPRMTGKA